MINFKSNADETLNLLDRWCEEFMLEMIKDNAYKLESMVDPKEILQFVKNEFDKKFTINSFISKQYCWSYIGLKLATAEFIKIEINHIMSSS